MSVDEPGPSPNTRARRAAGLVWNAWTGQRLMEQMAADVRPRDAVEGFAAQTALEAMAGPAIGWKIAATSVSGQQHIGVHGPLPGRLFEQFAHEDGATLDAAHSNMAVVEAEIAFRLGQTIDTPGLSRPEVESAVDAMFLAIEVPDSRFREFATVGEPQLLADNACAGRFVLGAEVHDWRRLDLADQRAELHLGGVVAARGTGANVLGHPLAALTWLVDDVTQRGTAVRAGDLVTTGTTTVPLRIRPGSHVRAVFPGLGQVSVRFMT